ncbi:PREDICTED: T-cell ecto-ADP-ribosyltransferase 2-like [Miniopterus natalensis]|uniref:T-cell ecto-ADP-ribosyltransferase 2-like n=1 Tax=Miniopterus natalensis TaxID=291302 RepID=UPI0007A6B063|nr:PREDICTED: T-cell ecto-ADP-ribosyltransferase 2-like [Miniopterus natalensis]
MTCLQAIAVLFLFLTQGLIQQVTGWAQKADSCKLDMAYNSFDDQYEGCTEEMEKQAPQLLKKELEVNKELRDEWKKAAKRWDEIKNQIDSSKHLTDFQGIALVAYTGNVATKFNKAVREFRQNPSNFQFKAFHYYLTRALQLLNIENECYTVYRGCTTKFDYHGGGNVRFGQFTSSSFSEEVAIYFGGYITLFTIRTCLGVNISKFSFYPSEREVLIPGYEVFQQVIKNNNNISLNSSKKFKSNYNCFYSSTNNKKPYENFNSSGTRGSPAFILLLPPGLLALLFL